MNISSGLLSALRLTLGLILVTNASRAATLEFSLADSCGRTVSSQDYTGVPIFLEFGACW